MGNIISSTPTAMASEAFGWRGVMAAIGIATVLLAIAIAVFVKDPERADSTEDTGFSGFVELLKMRVLWPIIPMMLVSYAVVRGGNLSVFT